MARKSKPAASTSGEIPAWFMTYSDVITLLMTFFILLLTFASNEPEKFNRMKMSIFNGRGGFGIAGQYDKVNERDSVMELRVRPRLSRLTMRGSQSMAMYTDAVTESLEHGLKAFDQESQLAHLTRMSFETSISSFVKDDGELTTIALQHLKLLAIQMRKMPLDVMFEVGSEKDLPGVIKMCDIMTNVLKIPTGRVSAGIATGDQVPQHGLRITVIRTS